jgi:hypothetical protein
MSDELLVRVRRRPPLRPMVHLPSCPHARRARRGEPVREADAQDLVACSKCLGSMWEGQTLRQQGRMLP